MFPEDCHHPDREHEGEWAMSVQVAAEDVLKALKRFKRLAKQDFLASEQTPDPGFWRAQAESRRRVYDWLMQQVQDEGVARAYDEAVKAYTRLPLHRATEGMTPEVAGERQALELFFGILGVPTPGQGTRDQASPATREGAAMGGAGEGTSGGGYPSSPAVMPCNA